MRTQFVLLLLGKTCSVARAWLAGLWPQPQGQVLEQGQGQVPEQGVGLSRALRGARALSLIHI